MGYMLPTEHKQAKLSPSSAKASLVLVLTLNRLFLSSRCSHSRERVGWGGVVVKPRSSHESCRLWALLKAAPANKNPNNGKYREVKRHQLQHISFLGQKSDCESFARRIFTTPRIRTFTTPKFGHFPPPKKSFARRTTATPNFFSFFELMRKIYLY